MSTTLQVLVTPILITAQALINKRPVEVVIFTPVNITDPSIVKDTVPVVVVALEPVKTKVATSPLAVPVVTFKIFVDNVKLASPVSSSSPIAIERPNPVSSSILPALASTTPIVEFNESPTTI